ncbi:phosphatase PAP2 family protein [Legionella dresdenensis]|uniref:undecaprenyl-diphosphate phosphatase n=1 Tax=Legionella dresdenensis TaxID=450200 RepID=A0ABV8CC26_9GAMM
MSSVFSRFLAFMTRPFIALSIVTFIVVAFLYIDRPLAIDLAGIDFRTNLTVMNWFTKLGLGVIYLALFLAAALFFRYVKKNPLWEARMWFLWLCVLIPGVICGVLKVLLGRARPDMLFKSQAYGFYGLQTKAPFWSFPSGHTTTIMGVALGLCVLFPRYCYAFAIGGFLVAASRVLLTHHYLSDVLAASYLTLLEIGLLLWVLQKKNWLKPAWQRAI